MNLNGLIVNCRNPHDERIGFGHNFKVPTSSTDTPTCPKCGETDNLMVLGTY